jgi:hypothetical protein
VRKMPPGLSIGVREKCVGSQVARRPPDVPTELAAQECQLGRSENMKSLAIEASTRVSCRKMREGCVCSMILFKEACFRGPPTPLMLMESKIMSYLLPVL